MTKSNTYVIIYVGDYPWNRDVNDKDEGIVRCFNWGDIFKEIKRFDKERKLKNLKGLVIKT